MKISVTALLLPLLLPARPAAPQPDDPVYEKEIRPLLAAHCFKCHSGANFSDNGFHNLGVGLESSSPIAAGRFPHVPVGLKDRSLRQAFTAERPWWRTLPPSPLTGR